MLLYPKTSDMMIERQEGHLVPVKCTECGRTTVSEYQENRWQCLGCGAKFVFENSSETRTTAREVSEHIVRHEVETFDCSSCGGHFAISNRGLMTCPLCKQKVCSSCLYEPKLHGPGDACKKCKKWQERAASTAKGVLGVAVVIYLLYWACG